MVDFHYLCMYDMFNSLNAGPKSTMSPIKNENDTSSTDSPIKNENDTSSTDSPIKNENVQSHQIQLLRMRSLKEVYFGLKMLI